MNPKTTETTQFDLERIQAESFVRRIDFHAQLESTSNLALSLCKKADVATPLLVLTGRQTAGRGRGANRWWSDEGALTFSLILETAAANLETAAANLETAAANLETAAANLTAQRQPQVSLTAALAVCEVLAELIPGLQVGLKWPNDVFLQQRKVCGILVDVPPQRHGKLVVGIGLNVNISFSSAPKELQKIATSLIGATGRGYDLTDVLVGVLNQLADRLTLLETDEQTLAQRWQEFCILNGRTVQIDTHSQRTVGVCRGIDDQGGLLLQTENGIERFTGGVVTQVQW